MICLLKKRVYDMAGILKVKVYLNDKLIPIRNFSDYVRLYMES
jgi:DNA topoisomerase-2